MRLAFLNPNLSHEYDVGTPFESALAGSQSAQCYLTIEMKRRGCDVEFFTGIKTRRNVRGIECYPVGEFGASGIPDAIVVLNYPPCARQLRIQLGPNVPILCWEHNPWNPDPNYHAHLVKPASKSDFIICVSEWQKAQYVEHGLHPDRVFVLRNAISPLFEPLVDREESLFTGKAWPPVMAFTSTPYKGLEAATLFFRELRRIRPNVTLNIFSSFDLYPPNNEHRLDSSWNQLYAACRTMLGVNYVGNVNQELLARSLKSTLILFFPSVLPETSSICILEAMAAGCVVICSALGGLPEVAGSFGRLVSLESDKRIRGQYFIDHAVRILDQFDRKDDGLERELACQATYIRDNYLWRHRAQELEAILKRILLPGARNL